MWLSNAPILAIIAALAIISNARLAPARNAAIDTGVPLTPTPTVSQGFDHANTTILRHKRASGLSDKDWKSLVENGCKLLTMMALSDEDAAKMLPSSPGTAESGFKNYPKDFTDWGYEDQGEDAMNFKYKRSGPSLDDAYDALGVDKKKAGDGGPNVPIGWVHSAKSTHDGIRYEPTQAQFFTIVNVQAGILVGWYKYGPKYSGEQQTPRVTVLPKLKNWADIAFLKYDSQASKAKNDISNLRYIFSASVANSVSSGVTGKALGLNGDFDNDNNCPDIQGWEKSKEFTMDTDEGKAFLASPNGRGAALLLITHKSRFPENTFIEKVTVWCAKNKNEWELNWLFFIKKGEDEEDPTPDGK